jgi:Tfp pilus assembly protein PilF
MFAFWAFYLYLKATDGKTRPGLLLFSGSLYWCGLLSKEIAITLPAMLLYYEFLLNNQWMQGKSYMQVVQTGIYRMIPYGIPAAAFLLLRNIFNKENLVEILTAKGGTQAAPNLVAQLATQSRVWIYYIREWLWPTSLSIDKPFQVSHGFADGAVIVSVLLLMTLLISVLAIRKRTPVITFGILWFFTALLPTSVFRLNVVMNDHRLYLPGLGATIVFAYFAARLFSHYRELGGRRLKIFVAIAISTMLLMGLGTWKRNEAFATEETMWRDVILKDRNSVRGYNNLGIYYEQQGEWDKALKHYQRTIKLAPMFPNPYINIGNVYHKKKEFGKAEKWMNRAIQLDPRSALANYNLGNILREAKKTEEAIRAYKRALELNPRYIEAANNLANIYFGTNRYSNAIEYYKKALFIDPTFAMSYYNIALAHERMGNAKEAIIHLEQFLRYWLGSPRYIEMARTRMSALKKTLK